MARAICAELEFTGNFWDTGTDGPTRVCKITPDEGPSWDIWIYDWSTDAHWGLFDWDLFGPVNRPDETYAFAAPHGERFFNLIKNVEYEHIHLIGHSAGSNLIETLARYLRNHRLNSITIHQTFLDPYEPPWDRLISSRYGLRSDWTDRYADFRTPPVVHLVNGYNVEVTGSPLDCTGSLNKICAHSRPYRFYGVSINEDYDGDVSHMNSDPVERADTGSFGFPLSVEMGRDINELSNIYDKGDRCQMDAGDCFIDNTQIGSLQYFTNYQINFLVNTTQGIVDFASDLIVDGTLSFIELTTDLFSLFPRANAAGLVQEPNSIFSNGFEPFSASKDSAYISMQITIEQPINTLRFNWNFDVEGEGTLRIYVDGRLVRLIDQRHVGIASFETEEIPIAGAGGPLMPGSYEIIFSLDGFAEGSASSVRITDVEFGFYDVIQN
jgi:hypothetical protein